MAWFSKKVLVTLIDVSTGEVFGRTEMEPNKIPETFALDTTMHIGSVDWSVVSAHPLSRSVYSKTRELTLHLRRTETMDPSKILYSLPSICDFIPPVSDVPLTGLELVLHEDDWRQFEFVSSEVKQETSSEIAAVQRIHENKSTGSGWRNIHVRKFPVSPIPNAIPLADVKQILGVETESNGIAYRETSVQILSGFSFATTDGQVLYGLTERGMVSVLGLARVSLPHPPKHAIATLNTLASDYGLELVHWCKCAHAGPNDQLFARLISENAI